jgi:putative transposase
MTNHVHLIIGVSGDNKLEDIIRDLKRHTSKNLRTAIETHPGESRQDWLLYMFERAGIYNANNIDWQLWQQHNHPIELSNHEIAMQRLHYLHNNPVTAGFVSEPHYWLWSSAYDYNGGKGPVELIFMY